MEPINIIISKYLIVQTKMAFVHSLSFLWELKAESAWAEHPAR